MTILVFNTTALYKVSICEYKVNLFLYSIFNFNGPNGIVVPFSFLQQYYQFVTIFTIFHSNYANKNISPFVIQCLVNLKRATKARNINNNGYSIFKWEGLIYSFSKGARLDSTLIVIQLLKNQSITQLFPAGLRRKIYLYFIYFYKFAIH